MPTNRIIPAPGHYIIQDSRTGKVSYWQKEYHQSAADAHGVSTADYIHAMYFFLMQAGARDVLMIGCGGGTLATMLVRSNVQVTVVDLHKFSFDIARKYFHLPDAVTCHVADGVEYLKTHRARHDALVLDAFGEGGMPEAFMQPGFFKLAKTRLKPKNSLFLMNVIVADDDDDTPDDLVRALRRQWGRVRLLDTDGWTDRNAVIAAGAVTNLKRPKVLMAPRPGGGKLAKELDILDWRAIR
ncbi:MAG: fused MFS/spermidine synthase [Alphaproteobacteria bacterium]|jgi:cyclopropane fatty-acyl-phospholipid synthase-like methyltransferase